MSGKREKELRRLSAVSTTPPRFENVVDMLRTQIEKFSKMIKLSQDSGKVPADYSLGFVNALIFCENAFSGRPPQAATFFNRTTTIGKLPMPVALRTSDEIEKEFATLEIREAFRLAEENRDAVIVAAYKVVGCLGEMEVQKEPNEELTKEFSFSLAALNKAVRSLEDGSKKKGSPDATNVQANRKEEAPSEQVSKHDVHEARPRSDRRESQIAREEVRDYCMDGPQGSVPQA